MRLYALELGQLTREQWESRLELLPEERQRRVRDCRLPEDRIRVIGAGCLLQYGLEREGIPREEQIFGKNPYGKPELLGKPVQFSLSHGGNWAVCAVGNTPVGVDVETPRCSMEVAARWFPEEEVSLVEKLPAEEQKWALCRLWTAREAFLKALGCGLTVLMNSFGVELSADGARLEQTLTSQKFRFYEYQLPDSQVCLCTTEPRPELEYVTV